MASIEIPYLNPLNFVEVNPVQLPQYVSLFIDDYLWINRLLPQQQGIRQFYQLWQTNDTIFLQFQNSAGQITIYLVNCEGAKVDAFIATPKRQNKYFPSLYVYEVAMSLANYSPGRYFFVAEVGTPIAKALISEPILLAHRHENSLLISYTNRKYRGDIVFETGFTPNIRVPGYLKKQKPVTKDTIYEDQVLDMTVLKSRPYRVFKLTLEQVPDWLAETISWVLGCSSVKIDTRYFSKNGEDAKFDDNIPAYFGALANYDIDLREATTRNSKIFDVDVDTNEEITLSLNVDSKGFADTSEEASSSVVTFINVE